MGRGPLCSRGARGSLDAGQHPRPKTRRPGWGWRVPRRFPVCGIVGYVGPRDCVDILVDGLKRLEYRGYDSAGIALLEDEGLDYVRAVGNLDQLKAATGLDGSTSTTGVGHTRWATHGKVSYENAHPLTGCVEDEVAVVLNGIVENFRELKDSLLDDDHAFSSETDAEVVAHLVERCYQGDLADAVAKVYAPLEGHFAFVVIHREHCLTEQPIDKRALALLELAEDRHEDILASKACLRRFQEISDRRMAGIADELQGSRNDLGQ